MMRGGTSRGAYFLASDLPRNRHDLSNILLAVMGSPDVRQIDGLGGAHPLTSKAAMVGPSTQSGVDVDYLFAQVVVDKPVVDFNQNCGNILAGIGPFAIEKGLVRAEDPVTQVTILMVNSGKRAVATIQTPGGVVRYTGKAKLDGVPGTAAPVMLDFLDTAGAICGKLLPTGNTVDVVDGVSVTCVDNGMPVVVLRAEDVDRTGYESRDALDQDWELKDRLENIRLQVGPRMNLGDVSAKTVPKMTIVAKPRNGGSVSTRTFVPHTCHASIGVLGAVSVASACLFPETPAAAVSMLPDGDVKLVAVEHPSGIVAVELEVSEDNGTISFVRSSLLRTTRKLFEGSVFISDTVGQGTLD
jgi:4-oxalomesaconate tautomerase